MLVRYTTAAAVLFCLGSAQLAHAASTSKCWRADEVRAARFLTLQNVLMIDALKCQDTLATTVDSYNAFLGKRRDMIVANKYTVQAHFVRLLGPIEGIKAATDYDTQVGNRLSASGIDPKRCESTALYARLATNATDDDLQMLAVMLAGDTAPAECPAAVVTPAAAVRPTAMIIPVWNKPVPAAPFVAAASPAPAPSVALAAVPSGMPAARTAALIAEVHRQQSVPVPAPVAPTPALATPALAVAPPAVASAPDERQSAALKALQAATVVLMQAVDAMKRAPAATPNVIPISE